MSPLHGHDDAVAAFRAALDGGQLHHAWLIAGPEGIGKGLFARKAALRVLAQGQGPVARPGLEVPDEHHSARLFASESHPDFRLLEREVWAGKTPDYIVPKPDRAAGAALARGIKIPQVRDLGRFFAVRPSLSDRRVVVIDAADDLEAAGANALLKNLEEPPAGTVFLLVSHAPERLLPTIRSRCRLLRLAPLTEAQMASALAAAIPEAPPAEIASLVGIAQGSPGRAVAYRGLDVAGLDATMRAIAGSGDRTNALRIDLAQSLSGKAAQARYEAFLGLAPSFIAAAARTRRGERLVGALGLWEQAGALAQSAVRGSLDPQATTFEMGGLIAALADERREA